MRAVGAFICESCNPVFPLTQPARRWATRARTLLIGMGLDNGIVALAGLPISVSGAVIGTGAPIRARGAGATQVVPRAVGAICLGLGVPLLCFATVAIVWSRWDRLDVFP